jgi:transcriptional regulator with XRE-family HTH domain
MRKSGLKTRLARARVAAGLTQIEFSKAAIASIDQIRHFEIGDRPMTSLGLVRFAQTLGVSPAWLDGIGDENGPVALDGEPYTREKYLEHKARGLQEAPVKWQGDEMDSKTRTLLTQRAEAWKVFLDHVLTAVFGTQVDWLYPLDHDEIGLKILRAIYEHVHDSDHLVRSKLSDLALPGYAVDAILRELRSKGHKEPEVAEQPSQPLGTNSVTLA